MNQGVSVDNQSYYNDSIYENYPVDEYVTDMEEGSMPEEGYYMDGGPGAAPALSAKEYLTELLGQAKEIRDDNSLSAAEKSQLLNRLNKILVALKKTSDRSPPAEELLSEIEAFQMERMEQQAQAMEEVEAAKEEMYGKLGDIQAQLETKEGPFAYASESQIKDYQKQVEQLVHSLDLGISDAEEISGKLAKLEEEIKANQVGNPEASEESTQPSRVENNEAYYEADGEDVSIHSWDQDKVETHHVKTTGTVEIHADKGEKVKIIEGSGNTYTLEVIGSEGSKETFIVDKKTTQISIQADFENVSYQSKDGSIQEYMAGMDAKIYVDGEESIEPDYRSVDFLKQLDDMIPEKNAKDIFAALQKHFGDLVPSDYKDASGNLSLAGLKKAIKDGIFPPKDPVAWGPKIMEFFTEIDYTLQRQYQVLASTKGWDAADPLTMRLGQLFRAFGVQARDPGNGGDAEDNIELLVNGEWVGVDVVTGRKAGYTAQFKVSSGSSGGGWDSPIDGAAEGAAAGAVGGAVVGSFFGPGGTAFGAVVGGAAGAVVGGAIDVGEDIIDSIF